MADRYGRVSTYGGNAGQGMVNPFVKSSTQVPDLAGMAAAYFAGQKQEAFARDGVKSVKAEVDFQTNLLKKQVEMDPMSPTYVQDLLSWSEQQRQEAADGAGFETGEAKDDFIRRAMHFTGNAAVQAVQAQREAGIQQAVTVRTDAENEVLSNIRNDPANAEKYLADFASKAERLNPGIPGTTREKMNRKFADEATLTQAEGMALARNVKGAREFLAGAKGVNPDSVRAMSRRIDQIENEYQAERSKAVLTQYADALDKVSMGAIRDPNVFNSPEFAELKATNPTYWSSLREKVRNENEHRAAEARAEAESRRRAAEGLGSGYSQAVSDKAWGLTVSQLDPKDAEGYTKALLPHILAFGYVPNETKSRIRFAELSGDPATLAAGAQLEDTIRKRYGDTAATGGGKVYDQVRTLRDQYGMSYEQAAQKAVEYQKVDPNILERRKAELPQALKDANAKGPRAALATALGASDPNQLDPRLVQNFEEVRRDQYAQTGDLALAQKVAAENVQRMFMPGRTTIGGVEQYVVAAPESFIAQHVPNARIYQSDIGGAITAHLQEELKGKVQPWAPSAGQEWEAVDGLPPVRLQATQQTLDQIRSGVRPKYEIQVRGVGGMYQRVGDYDAPEWEELSTYPVLRDKVAGTVAKATREKARAEAAAKVKATVPAFDIPVMQ